MNYFSSCVTLWFEYLMMFWISPLEILNVSITVLCLTIVNLHVRVHCYITEWISLYRWPIEHENMKKIKTIKASTTKIQENVSALPSYILLFILWMRNFLHAKFTWLILVINFFIPMKFHPVYHDTQVWL